MLTKSILLGTALFLVTVMVQILAMTILIWLMRQRTNHLRRLVYVVQQMGVILLVAFGLFLTHGLQILIYALVYLWLGLFDNFEAALYMSTTSFTTVGYGDIFIEGPWRMLGAIESANGFLLLGWSTIFLLTVLTRLRSVEIDWLEGRVEPDLFVRPNDED